MKPHQARILEDEDEDDDFFGGAPFVPPTWSPIRVAGIVMLVVTLVSYGMLFYLAAKRRKRLLVRGEQDCSCAEGNVNNEPMRDAVIIFKNKVDDHAEQRQDDDNTSAFGLVVNNDEDEDRKWLEVVSRDQHDDSIVTRSEDHPKHGKVSRLFCGPENQGCFSQLSKMKQTWITEVPVKLVDGGKKPNHQSSLIIKKKSSSHSHHHHHKERAHLPSSTTSSIALDAVSFPAFLYDDDDDNNDGESPANKSLDEIATEVYESLERGNGNSSIRPASAAAVSAAGRRLFGPEKANVYYPPTSTASRKPLSSRKQTKTVSFDNDDYLDTVPQWKREWRRDRNQTAAAATQAYRPNRLDQQPSNTEPSSQGSWVDTLIP